MIDIERSNFKYCDKCERRLDELYDIYLNVEVKITMCKDCIGEVIKEIEEMEK